MCCDSCADVARGGIYWSHWLAADAPLTVSQARLGGALSQPGGAVMSSEGGERSEMFAQKMFDCDRRDSFSPLSPPVWVLGTSQRAVSKRVA